MAERPPLGRKSVLHNYGAGGADLRVFLRHGRNFWCPLPARGRHEAEQLPCPHVIRETYWGSESMGIIAWKYELLVLPFSGKWAA